MNSHTIDLIERETAAELVAMGAGLAEDYDEFFDTIVDEANKGD